MRGKLLSLATLLTGAMLAANSARTDDKLPAIRQFDLSTIEQLGRAMYVQDQYAWKATDILVAEKGETWARAAKMRGWVIDTLPDRTVVRFVQNDGTTPQLIYDVTFPLNGKPTSALPDSLTLSNDELAQYRARTLALSNVSPSCSEKYNTIALADPSGRGWLVWALAATQDSKYIIVGGHFRFSISRDGTNVIQKDQLSRSCLRFERSTGPNGEPGQLMFTHIVSPTPIETQMFDALNYNMAFRIGTPGGGAWRVEPAGIVKIDMESPGVDGFAARNFAGQSELCMAIVQKADGTEKTFRIAPLDGGVITATERTGTYAASVPQGDKAVAVDCVRSRMELAPNDYKVVLAGYSLIVMDRAEHKGTLSLLNGRFQFDYQKADLATEDVARINAALNAFQDKVPK